MVAPRSAPSWAEVRAHLRLVIALKVNKVWPHAANVIIYGWREGQRRWEARHEF